MENNIKKDKELKEAKAKVLMTEDIVEILNASAPLELQEEWDNSGLQIGFNNRPIKKLMLCLEVDENLVEEAIEADADMIVSHHPLIFSGVHSICDDEPKGRIIAALISNKISLYSSHTPFDKVKGGNNDIIMQLLGAASVKNLKGEDVGSPAKMIDKKDEADIGRTGKFKKPLSYMQVIDLVASKLNISLRHINAVGRLDTEISTIGVCTGAGAEFLEMASSSGCDLFITGDVKYHQARMAKDLDICLLDAGHYGTEKFFVEAMRDKLIKKLEGKVELISSRIDMDPFEIL